MRRVEEFQVMDVWAILEEVRNDILLQRYCVADILFCLVMELSTDLMSRCFEKNG